MPIIIYSLIRIAAIVVAYVFLRLVGVGGIILPITAVLVGMMVSYIAFGGARNRSALAMQNWVARRREARGESVSFAEYNAEEDAELDAQQ